MSRMRGGLAILLGAGLLTVLTACSGSDSSAPDGTWGIEAEGEPQLVLHSDGSLTGTDGCNRLVGGWRLDGETVRFSEDGAGPATTLMLCEDVDTWLSGLDSAVVDGDELRIRDADGNELGALARQ